jgi:hypothetical protein
MAFGFLGLKPDEFWRMTPREFIEMQDARLAEEDRTKTQRANEVCATIIGIRARRPPSMRQIHRNLTGKKVDLDDCADMLAESRARVERRRRKRRKEMADAGRD